MEGFGRSLPAIVSRIALELKRHRQIEGWRAGAASPDQNNAGRLLRSSGLRVAHLLDAIVCSLNDGQLLLN